MTAQTGDFPSLPTPSMCQFFRAAADSLRGLLRLLALPLALLPGCDSRFPDEPPAKINLVPAAEVALFPGSIGVAAGGTAVCSLRVSSAPGLFAARFSLHFNAEFMSFERADTLNDSESAFFRIEADTLAGPYGPAGNSTASLSIIMASPDSLPNGRPLCALRFKTRTQAGLDSVYFAASPALTSLRNHDNRAIEIGRFRAARVTIINPSYGAGP
jgi:hypothetical protein